MAEEILVTIRVFLSTTRRISEGRWKKLLKTFKNGNIQGRKWLKAELANMVEWRTRVLQFIGTPLWTRELEIAHHTVALREKTASGIRTLETATSPSCSSHSQCLYRHTGLHTTFSNHFQTCLIKYFSDIKRADIWKEIKF